MSVTLDDLSSCANDLDPFPTFRKSYLRLLHVVWELDYHRVRLLY